MQPPSREPNTINQYLLFEGTKGERRKTEHKTMMRSYNSDDQASVTSMTSKATIVSNKKRAKLEGIMMATITENHPLVFLHENQPDEINEYTDAQVSAVLPSRDYQTRLFISNVVYANNSVWIRNHHSDSVISESNLTYIRDYFKASFATKNHTAAKAILASELSKWFDLADHEYYTLATTLASGLSEGAKHTSFEIHEDMVPSPNSSTLTHARRRLMVLLDILFSKRHVKRFLYSEDNSNIYRLVHCATKHRRNKAPLIYVTFSFLLQFTLTLFVVLETPTRILSNSSSFRAPFVYNQAGTDEDTGTDGEELRRHPLRVASMYVLASLAGIYSILITSKEYRIAHDVRDFYGYNRRNFFYKYCTMGMGPLQLIDFTVNLILPVILIISGWLVIINETDYIDAVLNTAAFLFIPEIDDQMPRLLGYDTEAMIENYLIAESKEQYDHLQESFGEEEDIAVMFDAVEKRRMKKMKGEKREKKENHEKSIGDEMIMKKKKARMRRMRSMGQIDDDFNFSSAERMGVQFNDYYITNEPERGSSLKDGILYQPCSINVNKKNGDQEIDPSNYITEDCLVQRVEWRYTTYFPNTTKPRVAVLKLVKLDGEEVEIREIDHKKATEGGKKEGKKYVLNGVYIVTNFVMSNSILKLRLCGSKCAEDFVLAMEYYSLWNITRDARKLLRTYRKIEDEDQDLDDKFEVNQLIRG